MTGRNDPAPDDNTVRCPTGHPMHRLQDHTWRCPTCHHTQPNRTPTDWLNHIRQQLTPPPDA